MIIDKVKPYWTEEDLERIRKIRDDQTDLADKALDRHKSRDKEDFMSLLERYRELDHEASQIRDEVESRYIKDKTKKELFSDVKEIVNAITREDYLEHVSFQLNSISALKANGAGNDSLDALRELASENYEHCYWYVLGAVRVQLNAFASDEDSTEKIKALVHKCVSQWYEKPIPDFLPLAHGKPTDALAFMSSRNAIIDDITGNAIIEKLGVSVVIEGLKNMKASLGIGGDKIASTVLSIFTQQNDFRGFKEGKPLKTRVVIDLNEYLQLLGYDIVEQPKVTPAETAKEKKRVKNQIDNGRKAVRKDLTTLSKCAFTWEEELPWKGSEDKKKKSQQKDFVNMTLFPTTAIRNGKIYVTINQDFAEYLAMRNLITQYPTSLLKLDGRNSTAYYIGRKLYEHYHIDSNQIKGTHNRISITSLLAVTELPSYEDVQAKDRGHWEQRIKEPLEVALSILTQENILKNWEYTHAKGLPLTDEEASNLTDYEKYSKLYILFEPTETAEDSDRIKKKEEDRKKAIENQKKAKQRAINKAIKEKAKKES